MNSENRLFINSGSEEALDAIRDSVCTCQNKENCTCMAVECMNKHQNPDILRIEGDVKIGEFRERTDLFYSLSSNMSRKKVLYLPNIDKMSEIVQNALLKYLEDSNDRVVCIAQANEYDSILPTVRSRMSIVRHRDYLTAEEFEEYCMNNAIGQNELYYCLTGGRISKIKAVGQLIGTWQSILRLLPKKENMAEIFSLLHLVKEKDSQNFAERHKELIDSLIYVVQFCFFRMLSDADSTWTEKQIRRNIVLCDEELYKVAKYPYKGDKLALFFIKLYSDV